MKRWVSGAMAFIITFSCAQGGFASEIDEAEVSSVQIESGADTGEAESTAEAEDVPVEVELTLGDELPEAVEVVEEAPAVAEAPALPQYARVASDGAEIAIDGITATLAGGSVVLVLGEDAGTTEVAFFTERGVVTGRVANERLALLDEAAVTAYLDALAESETVALYNDSLDKPLERVDCAFIDIETEPEEAPVEEPTEEPAEEQTEEPSEEPTEEAVEAPEGMEADDPEPVEEETEEQPQAEAEETVEAEVVAEPAETAIIAEAQEASTDDITFEAQEAEPEAPALAAVAESSIKLDLSASALAIGLKETYSGLTVTGASGAVTWSSSNAKVVKVDTSTGAMKGLKRGTATVTATAADGRTASASVTVKKAPKKVSFASTKLNMGAGGMSASLGVTLTKGSASAGMRYTSSNEVVATVSADGVVTAHSAGTAVITARTYNNKKAACKVTVYAAPVGAEMPSTYAMSVGQNSTLGIRAFAADGSTTYAGLSFEIAPDSPDPGCVRIDGSSVTAVSKGTAYVTAVTHNGLSCGRSTVTVTAAPTAIKLPAKVSLGKKETHTAIPYTLSGEAGCAAGVPWSSSNKKVVKVDPATGALTALKKGSATIVAKTHNGLKAKCKVTVKAAPKKVTIKTSANAVSVGGTLQFTAKLPKGSAGGVTWSSSNTAVATIDQSGVATGVAAGSTTITATTFNGKTAKVTLNVTSSGSGDTSTPAPTGDVKVPASMEKLGVASYQSTYSKDMSNEQKIEYVIYNAQNQLGMPYVYGKGYKTANPTGFDCSGFVYWCYYKLGITLGDSAYKQGYDSKYTKISDIASLKRGDVVCFNTSSDNDLSDHTGIYLGNGYFIHASSGSSKRKVCVQSFTNDSISSDYYKRHFSWGRRILP